MDTPWLFEKYRESKWQIKTTWWLIAHVIVLTVDRLARCNKVHGGTGRFEDNCEKARMVHCLILISNERSVESDYGALIPIKLCIGTTDSFLCFVFDTLYKTPYLFQGETSRCQCFFFLFLFILTFFFWPYNTIKDTISKCSLVSSVK